MNDQDSNVNVTSSAKASPRSAKASACGKAIIVGEHAVVYGSHAVAMPLRQMRMRMELAPHSDCTQAKSRLLLGGKEVSDRVAGVIPEAIKLLDQEGLPLTIKGHSSLPIGAGLGSSATLCVATLRSLSESYDLDLSRDELARYGNILEARFHGKPSGLDTAVVAYEQYVYFAKGSPIVGIPQEEVSRPWHFALIDSKIRASTLAMIRLAEPFFKSPSGDQHIERFDLAAQLVRRSLSSGDYGAVAEAMNECAALLRQAGVVPDSIESMLNTCRDTGVLAAKTTGAGGGGTILCLLSPENWSQELDELRAKFQDYPVFHINS